MPKDIEVIPFELNLGKEKGMFKCIYGPPAQNRQYFLEPNNSTRQYGTK